MKTSPVDPEWHEVFERWLEPFVARLHRKEQRQWAPVYVRGLLGPSRRKCATTMARSVAPGDSWQLHHFVATSPWDGDPLAEVLVTKANGLVGGPEAYLIVDDTALVKKGRESVGVARQYCGELGKMANCQVLVSLTLARREVPVCIGLRLFLPQAWADDTARRRKCGVPEGLKHEPKWKIALGEVDRVVKAGATFGEVLADAAYGSCAEFRDGLSQRGFVWTLGVTSTQQVYSTRVKVCKPQSGPRGRPVQNARPSERSVSAADFIAGLGTKAFRKVTWRTGTKGALAGRFAAVRVRVADGPKVSYGQRLPGEEVWLLCEERSNGERRYYLSNRPANTARRTLVRSVKARWACEQPHQQMKQELGLDHFEGRSWKGLHHHALLTLIAYAFLQHLRLRGKKNSQPTARRPARVCRKSDDG